MKIADQQLLKAASAVGTVGAINLRQGGADAFDAATHTVVWGDGAQQGQVVAEGADDVNYTGSWELIHAFTLAPGDATPAPRQETWKSDHPYRALRHRVTQVVTGGTVTTRINVTGDI